MLKSVIREQFTLVSLPSVIILMLSAERTLFLVLEYCLTRAINPCIRLHLLVASVVAGCHC